MKLIKLMLPIIFYLSSISCSHCPQYKSSDILSKCEPELQKILSLSLSSSLQDADIIRYRALYNAYTTACNTAKGKSAQCSCLEGIVNTLTELNDSANQKKAELKSLESKLSANCKALAGFRKSIIRFASDRS